MSDWFTVSIADFGKVVTGKTPPSAKPQQFGADHPFITPSDMAFREKHIATGRFLSDQGLQAHKRIVLPPKSICVVCIGATIGKACATNRLSVSNQQINSIIVDKAKHDPDFVYYLVTLLRGTLEAYAGGAATPIINKGSFSKIKLRVPDRETQQKIAAILTAYDDLIENNRQRIGLLEKMAEEIYREWFVRLRFPGHEHTPVHKGVPEGWSTSKIEKLANRHKFGRLYKEAELSEEGKTIVIDQSVKPLLGFHNNEPDHMATLAEPKVLFGDHSCKFMMMIEPFSVAENVIPFSATDPLSSYYLFYAVKGQVETTEYKRHWTSLVKKEIFWPNDALRRRFAEFLLPNIDMARSLDSQSRVLKKTRDILLNRLISGKLHVDDLDIQFPPSMQVEAA